MATLVVSMTHSQWSYNDYFTPQVRLLRVRSTFFQLRIKIVYVLSHLDSYRNWLFIIKTQRPPNRFVVMLFYGGNGLVEFRVKKKENNWPTKPSEGGAKWQYLAGNLKDHRSLVVSVRDAIDYISMAYTQEPDLPNNSTFLTSFTGSRKSQMDMERNCSLEEVARRCACVGHQSMLLIGRT